MPVGSLRRCAGVSDEVLPRTSFDDDSRARASRAHARRSRYLLEESSRDSPKFPVRPIRSRCPTCPTPTTRSSRTSTQQTLRIHHREHHATYVKKLNEALAKEPRSAEAHARATAARHRQTTRGDPHRREEQRRRPSQSRPVLELARARAVTPRRAARWRQALERDFGSFDAFRKKFSDAAAKHFASGWVALSLDHAHAETRDRRPQGSRGAAAQRGHRVLILDVWEHAYYLKYQNRRPGIHRGVLERRRLGARRGAIRTRVRRTRASGGVGYF